MNTPLVSALSKKILVVEDELPIGKALEIKLKKSGYTVEVANNGQEALDLLTTSSYDLLLLDIMMPIVDGWTVLEQIKDRNMSVKVIITSNLSQDEDITRAKSLGASDFLIKSNESLQDIVSEVERVLMA